MGTNVIFDLIGSFIIGGMLLVNILTMQGNANDQSSLYSVTRIAQKNLVTSAEIIENDFRKMGYGVPDPTKCIYEADTSRIVFFSDIDRNGSIDTVKYYLGPTSELAGTPNPRDRFLYRVINSETPKSSNLGITRFFLQYYDQDMNPVVGNVNAIRIIEITLCIESPFPIEDPSTGLLKYPDAFWRQTRITARNMER
jgi:hypothetical protein